MDCNPHWVPADNWVTGCIQKSTWLIATVIYKEQGDHLSGKPGNVGEFDSCQGKILSGKSCLKVFIVSCIFASIQVFSTGAGMTWVTLNMPSAVEECREPSGNCQGISHCLESGHPERSLTFWWHTELLNVKSSAVTICQILFPIDKRYDKSKLSR